MWLRISHLCGYFYVKIMSWRFFHRDTGGGPDFLIKKRKLRMISCFVCSQFLSTCTCSMDNWHDSHSVPKGYMYCADELPWLIYSLSKTDDCCMNCISCSVTRNLTKLTFFTHLNSPVWQFSPLFMAHFPFLISSMTENVPHYLYVECWTFPLSLICTTKYLVFVNE